MDIGKLGGRVKRSSEAIVGAERRRAEGKQPLFQSHMFDGGELPLEKNLQVVLAERPWAIEDGLEMLEREYATDLGPVDLLCRDRSGQVVAVEIKRKGEIAGVEQLTRYLDSLNKDSTLAPVRGILAATAVTPQARTLAADRGIGWVEVDYDALRGVEGMAPRLFDV